MLTYQQKQARRQLVAVAVAGVAAVAAGCAVYGPGRTAGWCLLVAFVAGCLAVTAMNAQRKRGGGDVAAACGPAPEPEKPQGDAVWAREQLGLAVLRCRRAGIGPDRILRDVASELNDYATAQSQGVRP